MLLKFYLSQIPMNLDTNYYIGKAAYILEEYSISKKLFYSYINTFENKQEQNSTVYKENFYISILFYLGIVYFEEKLYDKAEETFKKCYQKSEKRHLMAKEFMETLDNLNLKD